MNHHTSSFSIKKLFIIIFKKIYFSTTVKDKSAVFISHPDFADNIYPLFIELKKRGYKCLWVLNYKYSKKIARKNNIKYIMINKSIRNMMILSKYKYFFYSHFLPYFYKKDEQIIYDCWHGSPFKVYHGVQMNNIKDGFYFVPPSNEALSIYHNLYPSQIDEQKAIPYRHFRTDYFISGFSNFEAEKIINYFNLKKYKKVLLCCLTWIRDSKISDTLNNLLGIQLKPAEFVELNSILSKLNYLLIVKPHPGQKILENYKFSNIIFISSDEMAKNELQLYSLISFADILFTDYSSILFDYCLLNKPVGHIIHDWDYFINNDKEQFIYKKPEELMYGTKIHNLKELIDFIRNPKENDEELRERINFKYNDDPLLTESSTLKFIKEVLHEEI